MRIRATLFHQRRSSDYCATASANDRRRRWAAAFLTWTAAVGYGASAAAESVDYVTPIGNCQVKLDQQGNDRSLQLQPGETRFELWAHWIDYVTTRNVIVDDDDPGNVTLSIGRKRGGPENMARGCEGKGSVEVTVTAPLSSNANLRRTLRVRSSDRTFDQPINIVNLPSFALTWDPVNQVPTCLTKQPAGSAQFLANNKRLEIRLPPGHATDQTNCAGDLRLKASFASYSVDVESKSPQFNQSHSVTAVEKAPPAPVSAVGRPPLGARDLQVNLPAYTALSPPPALYNVNAGSLSVHDLLPFRTNDPVLNLRPLDIRRLTRETVLTIRIADPDGNADTVELAIFPSNVNGFSAAANCTPAPVNAGNLITCRATLAQPAAAGTTVVYKLTSAACFAGESGQVPYTPTPADPSGIQAPIGITAGATFVDFVFRTLNAANCAGQQQPVTHLFEAALSTADMLNHTAGRYTSATIAVRRPLQ